jgi:hypothetical protein
VIALASEMDGPMTIGEISWQRAGSYGSETGHYYGFRLYMGVAADSELTNTFADNYVHGTRTLVYSTAAQQMTALPDQWMSILLDTPYYYNGTEDLVIELEWVGGSNMFYTYLWDTGTNRGLMNKSDVGSPIGELYTTMSELMFAPASALEERTFGSIKAMWAD